MILPHDTPAVTPAATPAEPPAAAPAATPAAEKHWQVPVSIRVTIPVDLRDAPDADDALRFAGELLAKLPLKVTLGDVVLHATPQ
jgi:hypothetical protein